MIEDNSFVVEGGCGEDGKIEPFVLLEGGDVAKAEGESKWGRGGGGGGVETEINSLVQEDGDDLDKGEEDDIEASLSLREGGDSPI